MNGLDDSAPHDSYDVAAEQARAFVDGGSTGATILRSVSPPLVHRIIEAEIIPRLFMTRGQRVHPNVAVAAALDRSEPTRFAELVLGADNEDAAQCIQRHRDRGVALETIYLNLFVPAASHMRRLWVDDAWDFAALTLGFWRLQRLLRDLSPSFCAESAVKSTGLRALLTRAPDENRDVGHMIFGLVLAGEFLRRDGWETWIEPDAAVAPLIDTVRSQWFDVVEFFSNSDRTLDGLAANIRAVRRESPNRDIGIMVGGAAFVERPDLVFLVGGDAVVPDFRKQSAKAQDVVALLSKPAVGRLQQAE